MTITKFVSVSLSDTIKATWAVTTLLFRTHNESFASALYTKAIKNTLEGEKREN